MAARTGGVVKTSHAWIEQAACGRAPAYLFDAMTSKESAKVGSNTADTFPRIQGALAYCADCPVWKQCLADRADNVDIADVGVYGRQYVGRREAERRMARAKARRKRLTGRTRQRAASQVRQGSLRERDTIDKRNAQMIALHDAGVSFRELGRQFEISAQTVYQVWLHAPQGVTR